MKIIGPQLVLQTAVLAIAFAGACRAEDAKAPAVAKQEVAAKLAYCEVCHGVSAQGFHGYYPIPRLAGPQTEFLGNPAAGVSRAPGDKQYHVKGRPRPKPGEGGGPCRRFSRSRPQAARRRA